ncbi:hypothetical protein [Sorangium cellulosum]|uniref:hypothetical protein n=1 Tax=Sorangium cellulosum TaxID=56 RepID=UPI0013319D9B|nr:hypothetical protein [Sorangium cellulosum]
MTDNALIPNALIPNALIPNALIPNALIPNALIPNALDPASLGAIRDPGQLGEVSRQFLRYAVGCALGATQVFSFSWTDAGGVVHGEVYPGVLGIAPSWATQPLNDVTKQRLVSGCIASRANYFGVNVVISLRSPQNPLRRLVPEAEVAAYPVIEGAFWGNLFTASPSIRACYHAAGVATARAALRECAVGHLDAAGGVVPCGPIALAGACDVPCPNIDRSGRYYTGCSDPSGSGNVMQEVITTALP